MRQSETERDRSRQGETERDRARQSETDRDRARQSETERDSSRQGVRQSGGGRVGQRSCAVATPRLNVGPTVLIGTGSVPEGKCLDSRPRDSRVEVVPGGSARREHRGKRLKER